MHPAIMQALGAQPKIFGSGRYTQNIVQGGVVLQPDANGLITITGAATVAPDATSLSSVVVCDKLLVTGPSASLSPSTSSKGLLIFAKTSVTLESGGRIHCDGIRYGGDFGGVFVPSVAPDAIAKRIKRSAYLAYVIGSIKTAAGTAATTRCAGGGGNGGNGWTSNIGSWAGGSGGSAGTFSGGSGGGGGSGKGDGEYGADHREGYPAQPYGGAPGIGSGHSFYLPGGDGGVGGGFVSICTPSLTIGNGCSVSANGSQGGTGGAHEISNTFAGAGGGGGGGIVFILTNPLGYTNYGTISANGGPSGGGTANASAGAAGSVNIYSVSA